jgi:hypothetical protein
MCGLFVIVDRDKHGGVGLARTHLAAEEAARICAALARTYPTHIYTVERQRYVKGTRRVAYPTPQEVTSGT